MSICSTAVLGGSHATDARPDAVKSMTWLQVDLAGRSIALNPPGRLQTKKRRAVVPIYRGLPEIDYPMHDRDVLVTACGRICMHKKKINISTVMAGQRLGLKEVDDGIWVVTSWPTTSDISTWNRNTATYRQPVRYPRVTHVLGTFCYPCLRVGHR